jgi:hypothetical protein
MAAVRIFLFQFWVRWGYYDVDKWLEVDLTKFCMEIAHNMHIHNVWSVICKLKIKNVATMLIMELYLTNLLCAESVFM